MCYAYMVILPSHHISQFLWCFACWIIVFFCRARRGLGATYQIQNWWLYVYTHTHFCPQTMMTVVMIAMNMMVRWSDYLIKSIVVMIEKLWCTDSIYWSRSVSLWKMNNLVSIFIRTRTSTGMGTLRHGNVLLCAKFCFFVCSSPLEHFSMHTSFRILTPLQRTLLPTYIVTFILECLVHCSFLCLLRKLYDLHWYCSIDPELRLWGLWRCWGIGLWYEAGDFNFKLLFDANFFDGWLLACLIASKNGGGLSPATWYYCLMLIGWLIGLLIDWLIA